MRAEDDNLPWSANTLDIVRHYSYKIKNGRTILDAARHTEAELVELYTEIEKVATGEPAGDDGVVGEAIDIIACALDIIFMQSPNITNAEIDSILKRKCEKWERHYSNSVERDRRTTPSKEGQVVKVKPAFIDMTELSLDQSYVVKSIITYDWQQHQPSKLLLVDQPEAIFSTDWFFVVEEEA